MTGEQTVALFAVLMVLAWSGVCWCAGAIWEHRRAMREDMNERDAWAERYTNEHNTGEAA